MFSHQCSVHPSLRKALQHVPIVYGMRPKCLNLSQKSLLELALPLPLPPSVTPHTILPGPPGNPGKGGPVHVLFAQSWHISPLFRISTHHQTQLKSHIFCIKPLPTPTPKEMNLFLLHTITVLCSILDCHRCPVIVTVVCSWLSLPQHPQTSLTFQRPSFL